MLYGNNTIMLNMSELFFSYRTKLKLALFLFVAGLVLLFQLSSVWALGFGVLFGVFVKNPLPGISRKWVHRLLGVAVIGLGANIKMAVLQQLSSKDILLVIASISFILGVGFLLGRLLGLDKKLFLLISIGTAICGGSAIAAVIPTLNPKKSHITYALSIVFLLNAVALVLFPFIGHSLQLSAQEFGMWAALAIHDTSSVVGATLQYGQEALDIGTTLKLFRAMFIVPVSLALSILRTRKKNNNVAESRVTIPWFIIGFVLMCFVMIVFPSLNTIGQVCVSLSKQLIVLTLFIIGSLIDKKSVLALRGKTVAFAVSLWLISASTILFVILA